MLTRVDVDDLQGHTLSLPLFNNTNDYLVTEIEGLDPVKATINTSSFGQLDGATFQSARRDIRNLVFHIRIEPYYGKTTVEQIRKMFYQYFMPKKQVLFKFYKDDVLAYIIDGYVESCETPLFTKDPGLVVSIICPDPDFRSPTATTVSGGTVSSGTESVINYTGTVETGYVFRLFPDRSIGGFSIIHRRPSGEIAQLDYEAVAANGDTVEVSTEFKDKHVINTSNGVSKSALWAVPARSKYGILYPGANYFRVVATGASIPWLLIYTPKYGGL